MAENVLIVDDVSSNRKLIKGILSKTVQGIFLIEAENGYQALDIARKEKISLVILDIMMPGMDGHEVIAIMKENPKLKNIPIIMCSAVHEISSIEKALQLGAIDYFTKPLTEEQMRVTLPLKVKNALEYYSNKRELIHYYDHIKSEMKLAQKVQKALICEYSEYDSIKMWGRYIPCEEVGGDIFCIKQVGENFWFMIADISGHGISAAMVSTMINVVFNTTVEYAVSPDEVLQKINKTLFEAFSGLENRLVSAFAGCINGETLSYANAGHPYPFIYRSEIESIEDIKTNGFLLGVFEETDFIVENMDISRNDAIILYTDGLFDKGENQGFSNWDSVKLYCRKNVDTLKLDESAFLDNMLHEFSTDGGKKFIDDVAIMLIKRK